MKVIIDDEQYPQVRHKVGVVTFNCPNCGKELTRTVWEHATEWDEETKEVTEFDHVAAHARCSCDAEILVADDGEHMGVYWLNEKQMKPVVVELKARQWHR